MQTVRDNPNAQQAGILKDKADLPVQVVVDEIQKYNAKADAKTWPMSDIRQWPQVDSKKLSRDQISALKFITFIEDHIPGYFTEYQRLFPLNDSVSREAFIFNREMFRFTSRWAQEEERHASVLFNYQVHAGIADADELRALLGREGAKPFYLSQREDLAAIFAYTLIQEKATQMFYRNFSDGLDEPLLLSILAAMAKDETRHFAFFKKMTQHCLTADYDKTISAIKDVLFNFKMPLADTLEGYWRWSIRICDATGYQHTEAYHDLWRVVTQYSEAKTNSKTKDIETFLQQLQSVN